MIRSIRFRQEEERHIVLFTPASIGTLHLPNRLVRSATAERMSDAAGHPRSQLARLYSELTRGGVGLIVTGHMYIHPSGKAHPEMAGIHSDDLIPDLAKLASAVHKGGGRVVVQINHGGMQCSTETVDRPIAPSDVDASFASRPAREMTEQEIHEAIDAFGQAARRAREAGFDGVQLHGAHGYLISQFLSPAVNRRTDQWGGDIVGRMSFLAAVCRVVRAQVGPDFPVLIKLGMVDGVQDGLAIHESAQVVAALKGMGLDAFEISGGIGGGEVQNSRKSIRNESDEAYFRHLARQARPESELPLLLVGGMRSRAVMEDVLESGDADFISMCRPLICEPDLPNRMRQGLQERSICISANLCWADNPDEGISCKCKIDKRR